MHVFRDGPTYSFYRDDSSDCNPLPFLGLKINYNPFLYQQQLLGNSYCAVLYQQYLVFLTFGITAANRLLVRLGGARLVLIFGFYVARRASRSISAPPGWDASPSLGYPSIKFAGSLLYTWVKRGTLLCDSLLENTMQLSPPRPVRTRTACSEVELTNDEATAPPITIETQFLFSPICQQKYRNDNHAVIRRLSSI